MGEPSGRELGRSRPRAEPRRLGSERVPPGCPPVEPELPSEGGDRPAVPVEWVQCHPGVLRLHGVPPVDGSKLSSPSLTGGTPVVFDPNEKPSGHPEGLCTFRAQLSAVLMLTHTLARTGSFELVDLIEEQDDPGLRRLGDELLHPLLE